MSDDLFNGIVGFVALVLIFVFIGIKLMPGFLPWAIQSYYEGLDEVEKIMKRFKKNG